MSNASHQFFFGSFFSSYSIKLVFPCFPDSAAAASPSCTPSPLCVFPVCSDGGLAQSQDDSIVGTKQCRHSVAIMPIPGNLSSSSPDLLQPASSVLDFSNPAGKTQTRTQAQALTLDIAKLRMELKFNLGCCRIWLKCCFFALLPNFIETNWGGRGHKLGQPSQYHSLDQRFLKIIS